MTGSTPTELRGRRIILVLEGLHLGGAERQALVLARGLIDQGSVYVEVWGLRETGLASELCDRYRIPWRITHFKWPANHIGQVLSLARLARLLRQSRADAILAYTRLPNVACGLVWRLTGARLFIWNQRDEGRFLKGSKPERLAIHQTPCFVSNSQHGAAFLTTEFQVAPQRVRIVNNGVELDPPLAGRATWRQRIGAEEGSVVACMVANLHSYKDHATLLCAWQRVTQTLEQTGCQAILLLAGRPVDVEHRLKALAYDLGLGRSVRFLGYVRDISGLLQAADLGVFSSQHEGCPNGVLECMAAGLAVAATDIPGIREAVGSSGFPFLAAPGDPEGLAECILMLARDSELRASVGKQLRDRIEESFSPGQMCAQMTKIIAEGLDGRT